MFQVLHRPVWPEPPLITPSAAAPSASSYIPVPVPPVEQM
jgi:hypothetical protein